MQFRVELRTTRAGTIKTLLDGGGADTGRLKVYASGSTPPAVTATTGLGTLLAELTAVTVTNNSDGTLTIAATSATAAASGTPDYARLTNLADNDRIQLTAAVGSGEASFSAAITSGGTVSLSSGTLTEGNA